MLQELAAIAFADPGELLDEHGVPLPLNKVPEEARRALSEVEIEDLFERPQGQEEASPVSAQAQVRKQGEGAGSVGGAPENVSSGTVG